MGTLIAIEGLDGSGKETQANLLCSRIQASGHALKTVSFPDYESESSALVRLYLNGAFGDSPQEVNPYAASSFYAVDRFASFHTKWKEDYDSGKVILADRYTTANLIYQMTKLDPSAWDDFLIWAQDFEYIKLGLPVPDVVLYLQMPVDISMQLIASRYGGDEHKKDIHEKSVSFLINCAQCAAYAAKKLGWMTINCVEDGKLRTREAIAEDVWRAACPYLLNLGKQ